ncbi:MAG TPA: squalene--hopene cyclase [Tepidisphaeraceae bacterium]|nr:squalene--hopene cyclase [Tepidisphaeraceae bacterium]
MTTSAELSTIRTRLTPAEPIYRTLATPELDERLAAIEATLDKARAALLRLQKPDGHWCGELQGDSILESEYLLLKWILGQENEPELRKIANYLRRIQMPNGGWSLFPGGPADISGTVKGYFALKLMGDDPEAPHMRRCRDLVRSMGGAEKCNSFTKFYFACLGQISFDACPAIPPEIVLLPKWFYFNLYHVSAWTRTMILPLGIVTTFKPVRRIPDHLRIDELYLDHAAANRLSEPLSGFPRNWREFFLRVDQLLKAYNEKPIQSLRQSAMRKAEKWLLEHLDGSEGLGAIFPPMVYILIVFRLLGYTDDHPRVKLAQKHLRDFFIEEGDEIRVQPCFSPVWDTGLAAHAMAEAQLDPESDAAQRATTWLLNKECRIASDWRKNCPGAAVGGWFFEYENPHYPDVDDTAMVTMALRRIGGERARPAIQRGINWLLAMQNNDGGWAAFDRTKDRPLLEKIPFADHNAMQDPSCPDITGRVLESLGHNGFGKDHPVVRRAVAFIRQHQDPCGGWWGRWGVNFVYGTWQILVGLKAIGYDMSEPWIQRAAQWLKSAQKPDGSFGETAQSYDDPSLKGKGESTPSQTAWGAMGLLAAAGSDDPAVERALLWLAHHQRADGNWDEQFYTGTGFPRVFYLNYHLYRLYFPVTALARYGRMKSSSK